MKALHTVRNTYTVIFILVVFASLWQMNRLGKGLFSLIAQPEQTSAALPPTTTPSPTEATQPILFKPQRIIIAKAKIDLPVFAVPLENGTWKVNAGVANYAEGTSLVNEKDGNVGIYGHNQPQVFSRIKTLLTGQEGDDIVVSGNNYRAIYKITTASVIAPTAVNVFYPTKEPTLTLITCDGLFSQKRYMVKAKLVKIETIKP